LAPSQHLPFMAGRTRTSRLASPAGFSRFSRVPALLLGATLALSGCEAAQQAGGAAAIVNGTVIPDEDVQSVSRELSALSSNGEKLSLSDSLLNIIVAPYVLAEGKRLGKEISKDAVSRFAAEVPHPSAPTVSLLQMQDVLPRLDQANRDTIVKQLAQAKITVNPRYGTFDVTQVALTRKAPNWIKPSATPPR
jgi:hypothetical protein